MRMRAVPTTATLRNMDLVSAGIGPLGVRRPVIRWMSWLFTAVAVGCGTSEKDTLSGGNVTPDGSGTEVEEDPPVVDSATDLVFSQKRGFYDASFELEITREAGGSVVYTLDGSDPRSSSSAVTLPLPARIAVNPDDTTGRFVAPAVVLRAYSPEQGDLPENVATHTYLFVARVRDLSPDGESPGTGWPAPSTPNGGNVWGGWGSDAIGGSEQRLDYGMDPDVVTHPDYDAQIEPALTSIPTISLVSDLGNFFDAATGIYTNAEQDGIEWERPGSFEIITSDGSQSLQVNTGIRIRGAYSRIGTNPKHAFRLFFRKEYGAGELEYPLFGNEGVDEFDKIDLRTTQNYSWSMQGNVGHNTMNRDVFSRDLQRELGRPYTRSRYYHLYLNGVYWGLYQTQERAEANFGASYLGGTKDDYDTVKTGTNANGSHFIEVTDGTLDAWTRVWDLCQLGFTADENYYRLEGRGASGERDPAMEVLVDVDNLIDYMLVIFFTGNFDSPVSKFYENRQPNNVFALRSRVNLDQGFVFFAHDNEHTLHATAVDPTIGVDENRVNIAEAGTDATGRTNNRYNMSVTSVDMFHPQWLHHRLTENSQYRARFAARAQQVLEGNGAMTPGASQQRFSARAAEIETAIIAESARWGDAHPERADNPRTKNDDWVPEIQLVLNEFFGPRTDIVISQLRDAGLYPN